MLSESSDMGPNAKQGFECPRCKNNYSTAYSMYRHMRKVHNLDINRCVTLYCPIENCNESYDRYNALDTHLTHVHYADIRKETFEFSDLSDFEGWLRDITSSSKTKYIKRSCNNSYRYYRCHRSGLPKTSTEKLNTMKSSVKIGRHCPSRIIAKITDRNVQVEFVPTHIGHECEIAKIPLSHKKRLDIACRLATNNNHNNSNHHDSSCSSSLIPNDLVQGVDQHHHQAQQAQTMAHTEIDEQRQSHQTTTQTMNQQQQPNTRTDLRVGLNNSQTTDIIQGDNTLMVELESVKTDHMGLALGQQQQQQANSGLIQHPHMNNTHHRIASNANENPSMMLMIPTQQDLTSKFDQLLASIRSDKHALIVKAQLEVCSALIRD